MIKSDLWISKNKVSVMFNTLSIKVCLCVQMPKLIRTLLISQQSQSTPLTEATAVSETNPVVTDINNIDNSMMFDSSNCDFLSFPVGEDGIFKHEQSD